MFNRKKNLRTFDKIEDVKFIADPDFNAKNIKMTIPCVKTKKSLYYLENVLSDKECEQLILCSKEKYSSLDKEFLLSEREGNRLLAIDEHFATILYERVKEYIILNERVKETKPCGFGTDGKWEVSGINKCFRYNQYIAPSIGFKPHRDATFIHDEDTRSILSILIYLNDDFTGGKTMFYDTLGERQKTDLVEDEMKRGFVERFSYVPKKGSILIFNHNMIHEGESVSDGEKYLIRSDIVFKRVSRPDDYNYEWRKSVEFLETVNYFREAINCELDGKLKEASIFYQKELAIRQTCK